MFGQYAFEYCVTIIAHFSMNDYTSLKAGEVLQQHSNRQHNVTLSLIITGVILCHSHFDLRPCRK